MKKQAISLLLSLFLLLNLLTPLTALAEEGVVSGSCGDRVTWSLDLGTGVLSFAGYGRTYDGGEFGDLSPQWWVYGDSVREIRFGEGITSIGAGFFEIQYYATNYDLQRMRNVRTLCLPANISRIGAEAFAGLSRLDEITILDPNCRIAEGGQTLGNPRRTVVVGYPDSTADSFANSHGYTFRAISCADEQHVYIDTVVTPQTCTRDGVMDSECVICHHRTQRPIPASHDYAITQTPAGTVYTCTRCGDSYVAGACQSLKQGERVTFTAGEGAYACFSFTPTQTDLYYFDVDEWGLKDAYGYFPPFGGIYTEDGELISWGWTTLMNAGQTYYYRSSQVYDEALPLTAEVVLGHNYLLISTTATCTREGMSTYACSYCNDTFTTESGPLWHDYTETVLTQPTCTQEGLARYTCTRCGDTFTETLPAAHQYVDDVWLPWYRHSVCTICGDVLTEGTPNPPVLQPGETVTAHFAPGSRTCFFRFTPETAESYGLVIDGSYPWYGRMYDETGNWLCDAEGDPLSLQRGLSAGRTYYFQIERYYEEVNDIPVRMELLHDYIDELVKPASCTETGLVSYTCSYCGSSYTEDIPAAHDFAYDVELPWYRHGKCVICGEEGEFGTQTPPALALDTETQPEFDEDQTAYFSFTAEQSDVYSLRFTDGRAAEFRAYLPDDTVYYWDDWMHVYLEAGQTVHFGVKNYDPRSDAPSLILEQIHDFIYVTVEAPTCTEDGLQNGICLNCGKIVSETVPAQHEYKFDRMLPWYMHAECELCGAVFTQGSETLEKIVPGETFTARIEEPGEFRYCSFTAETSGRYAFEFSDPDFGVNMWTTDGDFFPCIERIDYENNLVECTLFAGQTCCLGVGFQRDARTGTVSMSVRLLEEIPVTPLRLDQPARVQIDDPNVPVCFSFTPGEDGFYAFFSTGDDAIDPHIFAQDESGAQLGADDDSGGYRNFRLISWLKAGQTCYLSAYRYPSFSPVTSYEITAQRANDMANMPVLRQGKRETAQIETMGGRALFRFTPEKTGYYEFFSSSGSDTFGMLYDAEMNQIDFDDDSGSGYNFRLMDYLEAGQTYYYSASYYGGEIGSFSVILQRGVNWSWPNYYWDGPDRVTASCYDVDNPSITLRETVQPQRIVTREPTYTVPGEAIYIVSFKNELFYTQTWTETIPCLSAPPLPCGEFDCPGGMFADMPARDHWAHDAIDWALVSGITTGTSNTLFSPDAGCTRAQAVTFLWRAAGQPIPESAENPFYDVSSGDYYCNAVLWALSEGITTGTTANTFSPDAVCTRAQIVTFLWRFEGSADPGQGAVFADVPAGAYYEKAVAWAHAAGVTTGTAAGQFSPDATCTRAQVVTFLHRDVA